MGHYQELLSQLREVKTRRDANRRVEQVQKEIESVMAKGATSLEVSRLEAIRNRLGAR